MLKNAYFLEKKLLKSPQRRGLRPRTLRCYSSQLLQYSIECVSSAKRVLLRLEKNKFNISRSSTFVFAPIFLLQTLQFCLWERRNTFCARTRSTLRYCSDWPNIGEKLFENIGIGLKKMIAVYGWSLDYKVWRILTVSIMVIDVITFFYKNNFLRIQSSCSKFKNKLRIIPASAEEQSLKIFLLK